MSKIVDPELWSRVLPETNKRVEATEAPILTFPRKEPVVDTVREFKLAFDPDTSNFFQFGIISLNYCGWYNIMSTSSLLSEANNTGINIIIS